MINEDYKAMLGGKSVIRELSEYATARGAEIGYENVFDYSLGNPSVPCPQDYTDAVIDMYKTAEPVALHGYSPSLGIPSVRKAIAESLNRRFDMDYTADYIFPTTGAAGASAHALRVVTKPGDEVITFAPYFPEYQPYVNGTGAHLTVVPADTENFQINFDAFEKALNPGTAAVLINTPNNPSGAVYSAETLTRLAEVLNAKQTEYGHAIFLITDEPYREIVFDGGERPIRAGSTTTRFRATVLQVAVTAGRAHRLCGGESACHRRQAHRADVRPDQPWHRPQLPVLHRAAGRGQGGGRDKRPVRLRNQHEPAV